MTPDRLAELTLLRQSLHQIPEVSGAEEKTAAFVTEYLKRHSPDQMLTGLGGFGVAAIYQGRQEGPTVLIRCELDGLPIEEISDQSYRSTHSGRGHLCGHDGHMTIVSGLASELAVRRPQKGRVVLLFQPAEETGKGATAVIGDPRFADMAPDYAFSLHNLPGLDVGKVALCDGAANCASRGMRIRLFGKTSHAAEPQDGVSPSGAITQLLPGLADLSSGGSLSADYALATLTHTRMGEATFGISPGEAEIWTTLRTVTDGRMALLVARAEALVAKVADQEALQAEVEYDDIFSACTNHPEAVSILNSAFETLGCHAERMRIPQRWSEDFGQFGRTAKTAMFWLGSGAQQPQLHNPDYDFPDAAIPVGVAVFSTVIDTLLNTATGSYH